MRGRCAAGKRPETQAFAAEYSALLDEPVKDFDYLQNEVTHLSDLEDGEEGGLEQCSDEG